MKRIVDKPYGQFSTQAVLSSLVEAAPAGVKIGEMRARLELADKLRAAVGDIILSYQEHGELVQILEATSFTVVNRDLLNLLDAAINAHECDPPKPHDNTGAT